MIINKAKRLSPVELEKAYVLSDLAIKEALFRTILNKMDFGFLLIANLLTEEQGYFTIKEVQLRLGWSNSSPVSLSVKKLLEAGIYQKDVEHRTFSWNGVLKRSSARYSVTGKGVYIIRRYTTILRNLIEQPLLPEVDRSKWRKKKEEED